MNFPALKEAEGRLEAKQKELAGIFAEAGPEMDMGKVKSIDGDSTAKVAAIRALNDELNALGIKAKELRDLAGIADQVRQREDDAPADRHAEKGTEAGSGRKGGRKSAGELFIESKGYKGRVGPLGPEVQLDVELKDLLTTSSYAPETTRTGRVDEYITRPVQFLDLIPQNVTSQISVVYMRETVFTNNADAIAEGGLYPESTIGYEEDSSPVRKIGTYMRLTDETVEDAPYLRGRIDFRLPFMVRQKLEAEVMSGSGTAPHLRGILNTTGIQTQALGGDVRPDAVYKAMTKVRVTGQATPNFIAMHPTDWQTIRLMRTTDGIYIWGSPSEIGTPRMWGQPVTEVQMLTAGTALTGDSSHCELATKRGIDIQMTNSHADDFINGKLAIRADVRTAFVVYRPSAFATITGL